MRLPRGYEIKGAVIENPDRPSCPSTRWIAYYGGEDVNDDGYGDYDAESAACRAWLDAVARWGALAREGGFAVEPGRGQVSLVVGDGLDGHVLVYNTGGVSLAGKTGARQRLATKLHEAGLLRGCDGEATGGEWDLPPARARFGEVALVGHTYTRIDGGLRIDVSGVKAGLVWGRCYIVSDGSIMTARQPGVDAGTPAAQWAHLGRTEAQVRP